MMKEIRKFIRMSAYGLGGFAYGVLNAPRMALKKYSALSTPIEDVIFPSDSPVASAPSVAIAAPVTRASKARAYVGAKLNAGFNATTAFFKNSYHIVLALISSPFTSAKKWAVNVKNLGNKTSSKQPVAPAAMSLRNRLSIAGATLVGFVKGIVNAPFDALEELFTRKTGSPLASMIKTPIRVLGTLLTTPFDTAAKANSQKFNAVQRDIRKQASAKAEANTKAEAEAKTEVENLKQVITEAKPEAAATVTTAQTTPRPMQSSNSAIHSQLNVTVESIAAARSVSPVTVVVTATQVAETATTAQVVNTDVDLAATVDKSNDPSPANDADLVEFNDDADEREIGSETDFEDKEAVLVGSGTRNRKK